MSRYIDERFSNLEAYVPGEQPKPGQFIKLNTNEFPYEPANGVRESASCAVGNMNLYSDLTCSELTRRFKEVFDCEDKQVIFTNGSDEALYLCFLAFCGKNRGAAFADITYGFYSVYSDICCIDKKVIPLKEDFSIEPADYYGLNETIFIANPNAPTGKALSVQQIESVLKNNKNLVVIDEAYADFSEQTCLSLLDKYENLIIVGTFSKSRGMAGARLGYIITSNELASDIQKVKFSINPYNVNSLTQATAVKVLEQDEYYKKCISEICNTRDSFTAEIRKLGFYVIDSKTNFVFAKHDSISGEMLAKKLRENGILIRHFKNERISDYIRITVGTPNQMEIVVQKLKEIVGGI